MILSLGSSCFLSPAESLGVWLPSWQWMSLPFVSQGTGARQPLSWGFQPFLPPRAQPAATQELPAPDMLLSRDPLVKAGCTSTTHRLVLGPAGSSCAWLGYGWSPAEGTPDRDTKTCGKRGEVRRNSKSSWRLIYSIKNQHLRSLAWEEHNPSTLGMEEGFTFRQGKYYK